MLANYVGGPNLRFLLSRIQLLYQLQLLDSELDQTSQELAEVVAALGESEALKRAKAAVQSAEESLRKARTAQKDLELEVGSLANKIAQQEKLLYSGKNMSAKEAANLQGEVTSLKRWHEKREELLLEAMVTAEETEESLKQAQANLSTIQAGWAAGQSDLVQKQTALETQLAELKARRPALVERVEPADFKEYQNLRQKRAGRAVALVKNGVCQGCGMGASSRKIQEARAGTDLNYCSTCGRILYVP